MDLICLGDSLTFGLGVRRSRCWTALFAAESGWNVWNRGISGDTTGGMLVRLHRDVLTALGEDRSQCRVLVMGGTNDILFSGTDTGARANLTAMVYQLKACGVQPMVGIPLPVDWTRAPEKWKELVDFQTAAAQVQAYAEWLRAYCRGSGSFWRWISPRTFTGRTANCVRRCYGMVSIPVKLATARWRSGWCGSCCKRDKRERSPLCKGERSDKTERQLRQGAVERRTTNWGVHSTLNLAEERSAASAEGFVLRSSRSMAA